MNIERNDQHETEFPILEVALAIASVIALPVVIVIVLAPKLSGRTWVWRARRLRRWMWALALTTSTIVIVILSRWIINTMRHQHWQVSAWLIALLWIAECPWAIGIGVLQLRSLATALQRGRIAPHQAEVTRRAIHDAAFKDAEKKFADSQFHIPAFAKSGAAIVGLSAHPRDHRLPITRTLTPDHTRLSIMEEKGFVVFQLDASSPSHHLVMGATGSGKSTLLSRMALSALEQNFRVVVIDFKGGRDERDVFLNLASRLNREVSTRRWPGDALNLWTGSAQDIADRVMGFLPPPSGAGEYYRARLARAIHAVTVRTSAPTPRDAEELIARIQDLGAFSEDLHDRSALMRKEGSSVVSTSIAEALGSYLEPLRGKGDHATHGGFTWSEDWDLAVISIDSTRESQVRLGAAILHDFDAWSRSSAREDNPKPIMLIIDEGGVLQSIKGAPALTNLVSRGRSAGISVVIASQTILSLGDDGELLLMTGPTRWLGRTPAPEIMSMAAGTKMAVETGHQDSDAGLTGVRSLREQKSFIVDPDVVRQLPTFFWIASEGGQSLYVFAPPIEYRK